jgi:hypothetical protein
MEPSSLRISSSDRGSARDSAAGILDDLRGELRLMLGEICLSRPDLRASISKHPRSSQRLTRMMRRLEIERPAAGRRHAITGRPATRLRGLPVRAAL